VKKGDRVRVTYDGRSLDALVVLSSPNGRSLMIAWDDGMLGGHCGMMPILQDESGEYRSLMEGKPVVLTPLL
jgi:hypothetical protein